jgi:polar amino acid transport system substrate-binding protein
MRVNRIRALAALTAVVFACGDGGAQPADPADPRLPDKELVPPFAMKQPDGSWRGISIDLWRRVAERSHLRYRFAEAESVQSLVDGTAEGSFDAAIAAPIASSGESHSITSSASATSVGGTSRPMAFAVFKLITNG